jgi:hypothetical protein
MTNVLVFPFMVLWRLLEFVIGLTGRLLALAIGLCLLLVGALLTATVLGAIVGVPLMLLAVLLLIRAIF